MKILFSILAHGIFLLIIISCHSKEENVQGLNTQLEINYQPFSQSPIILDLIQKLESVEFVDKRKVKQIPNFIISFLEKQEPTKQYSITDSNNKFQSGCLVPMLKDDYAKMMSILGEKVSDSILLEYPESNKDISFRKLIFYGEGVNYSILSFYRGGFVSSQRVLVFKHKNKRITDCWSGKCWEGVGNSKDMIKYLYKYKEYKDVLWEEL